MSKDPLLSVEDISKHSTAQDCWIVVDGKVWDLTQYAPEHPGGPQIILKHAGRDASTTYNSIHAPSVLSNNLSPDKYKGQLDTSTMTDEWSKPPPEATPELRLNEKPSLDTVLNAHDFESIASRTITKKTWAFYSSAATDCITVARNSSFFDRIWFRPRILRNVAEIDTTTSMLGHKIDLPLFVSPAAMAKLVDPEGEKAILRGCIAPTKIPQCISTNASFPIAEILPIAPKDHPIFFQLYVNKKRSQTEKLLREVHALGISTIFLTVDAPVPGKREADERVRADESLSTPMSGAKAKNDSKGGGLGRIMGSYIDASLNWDDISWLRRVWPGRIVVKGVQTSMDAQLCAEAGVDGILISNHGGRSLDTSAAAVMVLVECRRNCPEVFEKLEVFVDGGIRRGADLLKCLCLGAKAVGMGRSFLYALNYGEEGIKHLIEIMRDEVEIGMRMLGVTQISQLHPGLLNTLDIDHLVPRLQHDVYLGANPVSQRTSKL